MFTIKTLISLTAGFLLAVVFFAATGTATGDEHAERRRVASPASESGLVGRVRAAVRASRAMPEFQLVLVATEDGTYVEAFGALEDEAAERLAGISVDAGRKAT